MGDETNNVVPLPVRVSRVLQRIGKWAAIVAAAGSVVACAVELYNMIYGTGSYLELKSVARDGVLITVGVVLFAYVPASILHLMVKGRYQEGGRS